MTTTSATKDRPWICEVCGRPIEAGGGRVLIMDADTRGYPHEPTPSGDEATGDMLVVSLRAVKVPKPRILAELLREYPELEPEDIRQVLAYAAASLDDKVVELPKSA